MMIVLFAVILLFSNGLLAKEFRLLKSDIDIPSEISGKPGDSEDDFAAKTAEIFRGSFVPLVRNKQERRTKRAVQIIKPIATYAADKEQEFSNTTIRPAPNPNRLSAIHQYTYKPISDEPGFIGLPYVVRATITPDTLVHENKAVPRMSLDAEENCEKMGMNKKRLDGNNDELGHLIAHMHGGPPSFYNVVPQTKAINIGSGASFPMVVRSLWAESERIITNFVNQTQGKVDLTIVVYYDGAITRPAAFGVSETQYDATGKVVVKLPDYFYSNNPDDDPDVLNG